jgi:hypothetical protein
MTARISPPNRNDLIIEGGSPADHFTVRYYTFFSDLTNCVNALIDDNYGDQGVGVGTQFIPNANGVIYTPPTSRAVITSASVNVLAPVTGVEFYLVPNGGVAQPSNLIFTKDYGVGFSSVPELIGRSIESGGSITANDGGNGGAAINISLTVTQFA